jgi:hypothetical protein
MPAIYKNHSLFSDYYLEERVKEDPHWQALKKKAWEYHQRIANILEKAASGTNGDTPEAEVEQRLIRPILDSLQHVYFVQPAVPSPEGVRRPDYAFFPSPEAKQVVTAIMLILTIIQFVNVQPALFGVRTYFGLIPIVFILPVFSICIVFYILHVYQNWPLMLAWFRRSPDRKKQRDKTWRAVVLITFMLVLLCSLSFGWYESLKSLREGYPPPLESMRIFLWMAFGLLAIHVWQRWRLTFSYFRRKPRRAVPL